MQRFGPINSKYGHRRLNVLFTRAKHQVRLFTSLRAGDITNAESGSAGVRKLAAYLQYAFTGRLDYGCRSQREPDSEFEEFVRDALFAQGYEVHTQIGVAGYFIDLGVKHPTHHGYLVGIECDGATYHSSKSARDRDRLRQEVLEGRGWTIYRVWSTDWFADPQRELKLLVRKIEDCAENYAARPVAAAIPNVADSGPQDIDGDDKPPTVAGDESDDLDPPDNASTDAGTHTHSVPVVEIGDTIEIEYLSSDWVPEKRTIVSSSVAVADGEIGVSAPLAQCALGVSEGEECVYYVDGEPRHIKINRLIKSEFNADRSTDESVKYGNLQQPVHTATSDPLDKTDGTHEFNEMIAEYCEWDGASTIDPRGDFSDEVAQFLNGIIAVEGPIFRTRLFQIYSRAAGLGRVGRNVRISLEQALNHLITKRMVVAHDELENPDDDNPVLCLSTQPEAILRTRGPRSLEEIPPSEIALLMRLINKEDQWLGKEELYREVLSRYELSRLTSDALHHLNTAFHRLISSTATSSARPG